MVIEKRNWPNGFDAPFCLSFDDFSPLKVLNKDYGRYPYQGINEIQTKLLKETKVKITQFVIPKFNFWLPIKYIGNIVNYQTDYYAINHPRNQYWLSYIKELISSERVEIAWHGYEHFNRNIFRKKHIEFLSTDYNKTADLLGKAYRIFMESEIPIYGFRQPGWGYSADNNLFEVLRDIFKIEYIAASSLDGGLNSNNQQVSNYEVSAFNGIKNIPQNITIGENFLKLKPIIDHALQKQFIISLKGHYCNVNWVANSFTENNIKNMFEVIEYMSQLKVWYATFVEIVRYYDTISEVKTEEIIENGNKIIRYIFKHPCPGFTIRIRNNDNSYYEKIICDYFASNNWNDKINYEIVFQSAKSKEYLLCL
ncbi:MAG: DUF2334 domain-containing protein [Bacteroidota bacterium]|nr:DUF2334 domain-containing protein [Bacteroidota bacterium]